MSGAAARPGCPAAAAAGGVSPFIEISSGRKFLQRDKCHATASAGCCDRAASAWNSSQSLLWCQRVAAPALPHSRSCLVRICPLPPSLGKHGPVWELFAHKLYLNLQQAGVWVKRGKLKVYFENCKRKILVQQLINQSSQAERQDKYPHIPL